MKDREKAAITLLIEARISLGVLDSDGSFDMTSEKSYEACHRFLFALEDVVEALQLQAASRTYSYQVDLLEASIRLSQNPIIWANGEAHALSDEAVELAHALREAWKKLCCNLCGSDTAHCAKTSEESEMSRKLRIRKSDLCRLIQDFDLAWITFENAYIAEIFKIQEKAKGLVSKAIQYEKALTQLEHTHSRDELPEIAAYQLNIRLLVACLDRLNSIANVRRESRVDLTIGILDSAFCLLQVCENDAGNAVSAARHIALEVVESFEELRDYLQQVEHHLNQLHPQLSQNQGLVSRLVRWEEAWEVGARYVQSPHVLSAICHLIPELRHVQRIVPDFAKMCEDCDAELFLVIPRIVWLCFMADPESSIELIRRLLPHRFVLGPVLHGFCGQGSSAEAAQSLRRQRSALALPSVSEMQTDSSSPVADLELQRLTQKYWQAEVSLSHALPCRSTQHSGSSVWDKMVWCAVVGSGDRSDLYTSFEPAHRHSAEAAIEGLMRELESWSMELQRYCPEDWNECINVLVRCIHQDPCKQQQRLPFAV